MTTWTTEDLENARKKTEEEEYSGGIPIPFAGWVQQDKEDTEAMLRHQLQIMQAEIEALKAKTLTDEEIDLVVGVLASCVCTIKTEIDQEKQTFKGYEHCSNLPSLESELKDSEKAVVTLKKIQGK